MKKYKKSILFLLFILIPFVVSARNLEDLELKWTDEIEDDGYIFNPVTELDPKYAEYNHGYNESKFIETDEGYLIIGNSSFNLYDRNKGLVKSVSAGYNHQYIEDGNNYIVIGKNYDNYSANIKIVTSELDVLAEYDFSMCSIFNFFIKDDSLVVVYEECDSDGYYLNSLVLEKETLKEKHSSKIFTLKTTYNYFYEAKIYRDDYYNYYYLDKDFNIVPDNLNDDSSYFISDDNYLYLFDKSGKELKSINIELSDNYSRYYWDKTPVRKYNNFYYVFSNEYKYDAVTKKYLHRVVYYKYDNDFRLVDTKILTGEPTSRSDSYNARLYLNKKGLFIYYSYNNQYYKIEDDFSFTTSDSSYMYDEIEKNIDYPNVPKINNQLNAYFMVYEYLDALASDKEEKLEKDLSDNDNAYISFSYDTYYDEDNEQLIIAVTWLEELYINGNYTDYTEAELIYLDEENYESPTIVTLVERSKYTGSNYLYTENIGAKMYVDEDNIIVALSLGNKIMTNIYDREGKLIKTLSEKKIKGLSPQMVSYNAGRLLVIFSMYPEPVAPNNNSVNFTGNITNFIPDAKLTVYIPGIDGVASYSYIEYYETPFNITIKTDGNGTIESTKVKASSGDEIKFTITPKEGYVLSVVKVTDSSGNVVTFKDNTFTMPSSDVTIEATFVPENPNTVDAAIIASIAVIICGSIGIIYSIRKIKWLNI